MSKEIVKLTFEQDGKKAVATLNCDKITGEVDVKMDFEPSINFMDSAEPLPAYAFFALSFLKYMRGKQ